MSAIVRAPATKPAITILREAVIWVQLQGYRVRIGAPGYGVHCISSFGNERWERDPRAEGIDPLGCAILQSQPRATLPVEAAAQALGGSIAWVPWVEGAADGLSAEGKNPTWTAPPVPRHVAERYQNGHENGALLRIALLSRRCPRHGSYALDALSCPACAADAATDPDEKLLAAPPAGEA